MAADDEGFGVEQRADGSELEALYLKFRRMFAREVEQQGRDQRTVDDEAGVMLGFDAVAAVVVDAVGIERQGGVAEEQSIIRMNDALPRGICWGFRRSGRFSRRRVVAIHDVVLFGEREAASGADFMADDDEDEWSRSPRLLFDIYDSRFTNRLVADTKRICEFEPAASPHPPRQSDWRKKRPEFRVSFNSELALPVRRQEIEPVP